MRNCCLYLHNFTKELRLCWRLFGPERERVVVRAIGLFVQWSKLDSEGVERPVFPLCDADEAAICPRYIKLGTFRPATAAVLQLYWSQG
jgi:hypothetical protein